MSLCKFRLHGTYVASLTSIQEEEEHLIQVESNAGLPIIREHVHQAVSVWSIRLRPTTHAFHGDCILSILDIILDCRIHQRNGRWLAGSPFA